MSRRTFAEFEPLLEGEQTLLAEMSSGDIVPIGGRDRPDEDADETRQIRAEFIRYLLLGGCKQLQAENIQLHEKGVRVAGALITGALDLEGCRIPCDLALFNCRFENAPVLRSAEIDNLFLNGSALPGLEADRLQAKGSVFLRGANVTGQIRLTGAKLGGGLSCVGAELTAVGSDPALSADRLEAKGSVFLRKANVTGQIRLPGAKLGGDLDCDGAELTAVGSDPALSADRLEAKGSVFLREVKATGQIHLLGAKLGGDLDCDGAELTALSVQGAKVTGTFFLREAVKITGLLDMTDAEFGGICDEAACWPTDGNLILDRCRYGAFTGRSPVDAKQRIDWLSRQNPARFGVDFWPHPWEQCAKVLREMGHRDAAREILIDKENRQRAERRDRLKREHLYEDFYVYIALDWLLDKTVRYGHRPFRAFGWLFGLLIIGTLVFGSAQKYDAIKPNDVRVLRSAEWFNCAPDRDLNKGDSHLDCFLRQPQAKSYPKFNPLIYSADTLLPIVALEMQSYWIPDDRKSWVGAAARVFLWMQIALGWALSLLAVAGFSGLIKSD